MSDRLLRYIAQHSGELCKISYPGVNGNPLPVITGQAMRVLLCMADFAADPELVCWASQQTIAQKTGLSNQNVSLFIGQMQAAGLLVYDGKQPTNTGGRPSNRYIINLPGFEFEQPSHLPEAGSFTPSNTPSNTPTNTPAITPAGRGGTEQEQNINTHTEKKERVSGNKALKNKLEALGLEYAKRQQRASSGKVEIENPAGWLRSVAKAVTSPKGEYYETACGLIEAYPEADTAELCDQLDRALSPDPFGSIGSTKDSGGVFFAPGSGRIPAQARELYETAPVPMPYPLKEKRLLSLYRERGYAAALEYTHKDHHTPTEADQLRQALDAHALSEAGIEQEHLRMSDEQAQIAAQLEAGYTPEHDAEMVRQLEAGLLPEAELAAQLQAALDPDPVAQLAARFTDTDT